MPALTGPYGWLLPFAALAAALGWTLARRHPHPLVRTAGAVLAGAGVYTASAHGELHLPVVFGALGALTLALLMRRASWLLWLGVGAVALACAPVFVVLRASGNADAVLALLRLLSALALGVAAALVATKPDAVRPGLPSALPPAAASAAPASIVRLHGLALVGVAAALPLGEGLAFAGLGLCAAVLLWRRRELRWPTDLAGAAVGFGLFLAAGIAAWTLGGEGALKPSELGRHLTWLALPIVLVSGRLVPAVWLGRAATAFVVALGASALFGLAQYALGLEPSEGPWAVLGELSAQRQLGVPGAPERPSAGGFFMHRLKLADVLVLGLGLLWVRQLFVPLAPRRRWRELAVLSLLALTLLFTFARAALGAAAVAGLVVTFLASPRMRRGALLTLLGVAVLALSLPAVRHRLDTALTAPGSSDRALIWSTAVDILADHPLGAGLGNSPKLVAPIYEPIAGKARLPRTYAHSLVLSAWEETGPLGLAGYLLAWLAVLGLVAARPLTAPRALVVFALAAYFTSGLVHDVLFHRGVSLAFYGVLGAALAAAAPRSLDVAEGA